MCDSEEGTQKKIKIRASEESMINPTILRNEFLSINPQTPLFFLQKLGSNPSEYQSENHASNKGKTIGE